MRRWFFSWIVFKSRAHRDRVHAKVLKGPRLASMMPEKVLRRFLLTGSA